MDRYNAILNTLQRVMSDEMIAYELFAQSLGTHTMQYKIFRKIGFGKENAKTASELAIETNLPTSNVYTQIRQIRATTDIIKVDTTNPRRFKYYIEI